MKTLIEVTIFESPDEEYNWEQVGPTIGVPLNEERTCATIASKLREAADFYDKLGQS